MAGEAQGPPGGPRQDEEPSLSLRPVETKILLSAGLILGGMAVAGRYRALPGAACGAAIAYVNFYLIRVILEKAFSGGGTVRKGFIVQYVVKFLALVAVVYLVVRSGWFDLFGFLLGLSALVLGVLLEGLSRTVGAKTK